MALIKCPECGQEVSDQATSCPHCGCPLTPIVSTQTDDVEMEAGTSSKKNKKKKEKKKGGCGTVVAVIVIIIAIIFVVTVTTDMSRTASKNAEEGVERDTRSNFAKTLDLTEDQEENLLNILTECGVGELANYSLFNDGEEHSSYYLNDNETKYYNPSIVVWLTNDTKEVEAIYYDDYDIYVDGQVIAPVTDYYVSSDERITLRTWGEDTVKQCLNYPLTAEFDNNAWRFGITEDGNYLVQGSVTAENAFGVPSEESYQVIYEKNGKVVSCILGGVEYVK